MDLSGISAQSKDAILKKMDVKTAVRFRQTNSSSDKHVEQMRFRQQSRFCDRPLILKITIAARNEQTWSSIRKQLNFWRKIDLEFSIATCNFGTCDGGLNCTEIEDKPFEKIEDPFKQLSAISFDHIFFVIPEYEYGDTWEEIRDTKRKERFAFCKLFLNLERLRLSCKWFTLSSLNSIPKIEKILKLVSFEKISLECPWCPSHIESLPIQHCNEVHLLDLNSVPISIPPVFLACSSASIASYTGHDNEEMMDQLIRNFFKDVERSRDARGYLKRIGFEANEIRDLNDFPGTIELWNGHAGGKPASISKMKIDGGSAYLYSSSGFLYLRFTDDEEDDNIMIQLIKADFGYADEN